jgi:hypothetical protein
MLQTGLAPRLVVEPIMDLMVSNELVEDELDGELPVHTRIASQPYLRHPARTKRSYHLVVAYH